MIFTQLGRSTSDAARGQSRITTLGYEPSLFCHDVTSLNALDLRTRPKAWAQGKNDMPSFRVASICLAHERQPQCYRKSERVEIGLQHWIKRATCISSSAKSPGVMSSSDPKHSWLKTGVLVRKNGSAFISGTH
jgi:hypothetical protein